MYYWCSQSLRRRQAREEIENEAKNYCRVFLWSDWYAQEVQPKKKWMGVGGCD